MSIFKVFMKELFCLWLKWGYISTQELIINATTGILEAPKIANLKGKYQRCLIIVEYIDNSPMLPQRYIVRHSVVFHMPL